MPALKDFGLLPSLQATLAELGLSTPTEIQTLAIPALLAGRAVVGVAETGSGKTLAYVLPLLHRLKVLEQEAGPVNALGRPRAVVLVPTRELGDQVTRVFKKFTHDTRLRVRSVLGGSTLAVAKRNVSGPFDLLVATPGRLVQFVNRRLVDLRDVSMLVFDETDQMLDQGFLPDATLITEACRQGRQMAMFSATVPPAVQSLIAKLFAQAQVLRSKGSHRVVPSLTTHNRVVEDGERFEALAPLLKKRVEGGTMIFTNTRAQCDKLAVALDEAGHRCVLYRGEMDKAERKKNLDAFRKGEVKLLVSTDLASRGLDLEHVGRVINYHLPQTRTNYLHRVGRTARAGRPGLVINLVTERDRPLIRQVEDLQAEPGRRRG
jgi:superfamily II DNA/RNA helicase